MTEPVAPALSPAGIVREPGVDDVLDRVYESLDAQDFRNKFLEGVELTPAEIEQKKALLTEIARECNKRLAGRVVLVGAWPELRGMGARFDGRDSDGRVYTIDYRGEAEARMYNHPEDREADVRETVALIVGHILEQREIYLHRMTGS